jgi:hypothetical protein
VGAPQDEGGTCPFNRAAVSVAAVDALAPLNRLTILLEKLPWVARQYLRAANHVPTGCEAVPPVAL